MIDEYRKGLILSLIIIVVFHGYLGWQSYQYRVSQSDQCISSGGEPIITKMGDVVCLAPGSTL